MLDIEKIVRQLDQLKDSKGSPNYKVLNALLKRDYGIDYGLTPRFVIDELIKKEKNERF